MKIIGKDESLELPSELQNNCGDIRGRDGEYLDEMVSKIIEIVETISVDQKEFTYEI